MLVWLGARALWQQVLMGIAALVVAIWAAGAIYGAVTGRSLFAPKPPAPTASAPSSPATGPTGSAGPVVPVPSGASGTTGTTGTTGSTGTTGTPAPAPTPTPATPAPAPSDTAAFAAATDKETENFAQAARVHVLGKYRETLSGALDGANGNPYLRGGSGASGTAQAVPAVAVYNNNTAIAQTGEVCRVSVEGVPEGTRLEVISGSYRDGMEAVRNNVGTGGTFRLPPGHVKILVGGRVAWEGEIPAGKEVRIKAA